MKHMLFAMTLLVSCSCNQQANVEDAKYERQMDNFDKQTEQTQRQLDATERQLRQSKEQSDRYDVLLDRWEKQADRQDDVLDALERVLPHNNTQIPIRGVTPEG